MRVINGSSEKTSNIVELRNVPNPRIISRCSPDNLSRGEQGAGAFASASLVSDQGPYLEQTRLSKLLIAYVTDRTPTMRSPRVRVSAQPGIESERRDGQKG